MANKSIELKSRFNKYLIRKKVEGTRSCGLKSSYRPSQFQSQFNGIIYFYEWSDINSAPRKFFTFASFEEFLKNCGIYLLGYQRDIIVNLNTSHITCQKGCKDLIIRQTWTKLNDEIKRLENISSNLPYNVAITRRPPIYSGEDNNIKQWFG